MKKIVHLYPEAVEPLHLPEHQQKFLGEIIVDPTVQSPQFCRETGQQNTETGIPQNAVGRHSCHYSYKSKTKLDSL